MATLYRKKDDVLARRVAGETLLVPIRGKLADMQRLFALNPVAEFVWQQIDGRTGIECIAAAVTENFEVDEAEADADVREFLAQLVQAGLAEAVNP
jgi:hypothetical protein